MKKVILALALVIGVMTYAYAHDLTNPHAFAWAPYMVGTDIWGLGSAQIDNCVDTPESNNKLGGNCGYNGQKGFQATVRSVVQLDTRIQNKWVSVSPVGVYKVIMGTGENQQAYDTQFSVTSYGQCPSNIHGNQRFRTQAKLGFNYHGTWQWTLWTKSPTNTIINCP